MTDSRETDIDDILQQIRIRWKWASVFEVSRDEFWTLHNEITTLRQRVKVLEEALTQIERGAFPGSVNAAINGQWQFIVETMQSIARRSLGTKP